MTTKHTPGPWENINGKVYGNNRRTLIADTTGPNARLIAAAPELLETLEEVYNWCYPSESKWIDKARAAIAKATGSEE